MMAMARLRKALSVYITDPVVSLLARTPLTPDAITWFSLLLAGGAAVLIATDRLLAAGFVVLFAGFMDMLDGALARRTGRVTRFGGILDSTIDRIAEGLLLLGILYLYAEEGSVSGVLLTGGVMLSSLLVSYIRSRAEAAGAECLVGLFTRPERVIILALGLFINQLFIALAVIAAGSIFTVAQRLFYVWRQVKE